MAEFAKRMDDKVALKSFHLLNGDYLCYFPPGYL